MTNPTTRNTDTDVPIDVCASHSDGSTVDDSKGDVQVYDEPRGITVGTGSYGLGHGVSLTISHEYVRECTDEQIEDDVDALLEVALERALEQIRDEVKDRDE